MWGGPSRLCRYLVRSWEQGPYRCHCVGTYRYAHLSRWALTKGNEGAGKLVWDACHAWLPYV